MGLIDAIRYSYPNARIRGMKSSLLSEKQINSAIKIPTIDEFIIFLENSPYKESLYLQQGKVENSRDVENILLINFIKTNKKVLSFAPSSVKEFLTEYFRRYEIQYIKNLIYYKSENKSENENAFDLKFFYEKDILSNEIYELSTKLKEAKNVEEIVFTLEITRYKFLRNHLDEYKNSGSVLPLILSLNKYYFDQLRKKIENLPSKDKEIAKQIIGVEIDITNILTLLRKIEVKSLNGNEEKKKIKIKKFLILPSYLLSERIIENSIKCNSVEDLITKLGETSYGKILSEKITEFQKTKSLLTFELTLEEYLLKRNKRLLEKDPFQIGILLGYLKLKENEIKNLRKIAIGIENKLNEEEINSLIITI